MNNKVNYTLVGLSVLVGFFLIFGFGYWLLKPTDDEQTKNYLIYFDESVLGLNIDAPVKYRGISVGKVKRLRINPKNSEEVEVLITILKTTPIKESTVAKLTAQGITGLSYINLSLGQNNAPPLKAKDGELYPVIKAVPSFFENFEKSLGSVSSKFSKTLTKTNKLLDDENQKQIAIILKHSASVAKKVDMALDEKTIKHLQVSIQRLDEITTKMDNLVPQIDKFLDNSVAWEDKISGSFKSIMNSYLGIRSSMDEIKRAVASGEFNFKDITAEVMPTLNNSLLEMQDVMVKITSILDKYESSPRSMIFKEQTVIKAPGEK